MKEKLILTNRLTLKPFLDQDYKEVIKLFTNTKIKKSYMLPDLKTKEEKVNFFVRIKEKSADPHRFIYGIFFNGEVVGFINEVEKNNDTIELGYIISPHYWNKGFASEALTKAISVLFLEGYKHITAAHFKGNDASGRVMQKAGMKRLDKTGSIEYRNVSHELVYYQIDK